MAHTIQSGKTNKAGTGLLTINFPQPFTEIPVVVVSPFWQNEEQVGAIETINTVSLESFTITSNNAAADYYVSWIAVGP